MQESAANLLEKMATVTSANTIKILHETENKNFLDKPQRTYFDS